MIETSVSYDTAQQTEKIEYRLIETSKLLANSLISKSYGIAVYRKGHKLQDVQDITTDKKQLEQLVDLCNREQLAYCHLYDVVEDFLGSIYGIAF